MHLESFVVKTVFIWIFNSFRNATCPFPNAHQYSIVMKACLLMQTDHHCMVHKFYSLLEWAFLPGNELLHMQSCMGSKGKLLKRSDFMGLCNKYGAILVEMILHVCWDVLLQWCALVLGLQAYVELKRSPHTTTKAEVFILLL